MGEVKSSLFNSGNANLTRKIIFQKLDLGFPLERRKRTTLVVQWLRLRASNTGRVGSILGWGTKIPHAMWRSWEKYTHTHTHTHIYI